MRGCASENGIATAAAQQNPPPNYRATDTSSVQPEYGTVQNNAIIQRLAHENEQLKQRLKQMEELIRTTWTQPTRNSGSSTQPITATGAAAPNPSLSKNSNLGENLNQRPGPRHAPSQTPNPQQQQLPGGAATLTGAPRQQIAARQNQHVAQMSESGPPVHPANGPEQKISSTFDQLDRRAQVMEQVTRSSRVSFHSASAHPMEASKGPAVHVTRHRANSVSEATTRKPANPAASAPRAEYVTPARQQRQPRQPRWSTQSTHKPWEQVSA